MTGRTHREVESGSQPESGFSQSFAAVPHCHLGSQSVSNLPQPSRLWAAATGWAIWRPLTSGRTRAPAHGAAVTCIHSIMQTVIIRSHTALLVRMQIRSATLKSTWEDFPSGPVVKNPPANAGDMGSIPDLGTKIPHIVGQLSPQLLKPAPREPALCSKRNHRNEKPAHHI